jgi:hypothetical protein
MAHGDKQVTVVYVWEDAVMSPNDREEPPGLVWWRVPDDELGIALPDRLVVARSHQFAIIVGEITAYTRGFQVTAAVRVSRHLSEKDREWFVPDITRSSLLRIAIRYADGSESGDERPAIGGRGRSRVGVDEASLSERPTGVQVIPVAASTTSYAGESVYWAFPLPPPGPVTITCEWVSAGVPPESIQLDGDRIREAGLRSAALWQD